MEYNRTLTQLEALRTRTEFTSMRLTPWQDIWTSMALARRGGHTHMAEALYDALIQSAVFDDRGAWSLKTPRHG